MGWDALAVEGIIAVGHLVVWVAIFNRMHATGIPRWIKKIGERTIYLLVLVIGVSVVATDLARATPANGPTADGWVPTLLGISVPAWHVAPTFVSTVDFYRSICLVAAIAAAVRWGVWKVTLRRPPEFSIGAKQRHRLTAGGPTASGDPSLAVNGDAQETGVDPGEPIGCDRSVWCGDPLTRILAGLPANQILDIEVNDKELRLPHWPAAFDGLTIVHLSDFHLTGRMTLAFYRKVAALAGDLDGDVVVATGDLVDRAVCLDWLEPIFAPLRAREERFFILGNHDKRIPDERQIRDRMRAAGWSDVAGIWHPQRRGNSTLWWSGNELPWYHGAESLVPKRRGQDEARILLSHAPDQIEFARSHDFDLVLAGHTHGGQIRPVLIGPIVSPSHYGPKYASGEFRVGSTWMHVSRGIAGTHPIRINCLPEITRLTVRRDG